MKKQGLPSNKKSISFKDSVTGACFSLEEANSKCLKLLIPTPSDAPSTGGCLVLSQSGIDDLLSMLAYFKVQGSLPSLVDENEEATKEQSS